MAISNWKLALFGLVCALLGVDAFHNGAPCSTQYTMTPSTIFHGVAQNPGPRPPPYKFEVVDMEGNPVTEYRDEVYKIRLVGEDSSFRGFLLQARPATAEGYPIGHLRAGQFVRDNSWGLQGIKIQPCPGVFNDSLTHATNDDRSAIEVKWKPGKNHGPVLFMLTVVQNRTLFWTQWLPSSGLLTPEEGAKFGNADAGHNKSGHKPAKSEEAPADPEITQAPESEQETTVQVEQEETTEPTEEPATTKAPRRKGKGKGKGKGRGRGKGHKKTTTAAPVDTTEAETTEPVPVTDEQPPPPTAGHKGKKVSSEEPPPPPQPGSSEKLPPAPAAAAATPSEESGAQEPKPSGRRPTPKGKKRPLAATEPSVETSEGVEAQPVPPTPASKGLKVKPETTGEPDDIDAGLPPPPPSVSSGKEPQGRPGDKLPPAAPVGVEEGNIDSQANKNVDKPPADLQSGPPPASPGEEPPVESDTTDYCTEKPCFNNGTCINVPDEERYECRCTRNFTGSQCTEPNLCVGHQCKNGANCISGQESYSCKCAREWAGELCEKPCPAYLCENGGTCIITNNGGSDVYGCICAAGYTGPRCHNEIKHCDSNPCQNGATCIHKFNAFECKCKDGYMGEICHRPCQDVYRSCDFWGEQEKCETQRPTTKWFDTNCALTCGQCKYDNHTVSSNVTIPPVLEPFDFLLGRWTLNSTSKQRFPVDFIHNNSAGYYEELVFSVAEIPQFGPPSINVSAIAINNQNPHDVIVTVGFLTVRPATIPLKTFLMTTGNDGITAVESGFTNGTVITLSAQYFANLPWVDDRAPATAKRTFSIANSYLKEDVERTTNNGQKDYFTKYYWRAEKFDMF